MGLKSRTPSPARRSPARVPAGKGGTRRAASRRVSGETVDGYLARLGAGPRAIADTLRDIIRAAAPDATESIKWAQPVYEQDGPFCYLRGGLGHVELGFWRGAELSDPRGLLEPERDRMMRMKLSTVDRLDADAVSDLVLQAVELNRVHGNPTRPTVARTVPPPPPRSGAVPHPIDPATEVSESAVIEERAAGTGGDDVAVGGGWPDDRD